MGYILYVFLTHWSFGGHLGDSITVVIVSNSVINMGVQVSLSYASLYSSESIPRSFKTESCDSHSFTLLSSLY
jgi:hypothetical protein